MSVLIKGMEMPEACGLCPCAYWTEGAYSDVCQAANYPILRADIEPYFAKGRPDWCPLIEVPKHGRLIDADELHETIKRWVECGGYSFETQNAIRCALYEIETAPTVIEEEV